MVCMGMGIPITIGFPRDSHGNGYGSSFGLHMKTGREIVLMGMGIAYFVGEKNKIPIHIHRFIISTQHVAHLP